MSALTSLSVNLIPLTKTVKSYCSLHLKEKVVCTFIEVPSFKTVSYRTTHVI